MRPLVNSAELRSNYGCQPSVGMWRFVKTKSLIIMAGLFSMRLPIVPCLTGERSEELVDQLAGRRGVQ